MNTLIVYYSQTGITKKVAEKLQTYLNADIFEIKPVKDYGSYSDAIAIAGKEFESGELPAYQGEVDNFDAYDRILVGYPLWYNKAPQVVLSFLLNHNLVEKEIYPFCTSGSQEVHNSVEELQKSCPQAFIHKGIRVTSFNTKQIDKWLGE